MTARSSNARHLRYTVLSPFAAELFPALPGYKDSTRRVSSRQPLAVTVTTLLMILAIGSSAWAEDDKQPRPAVPKATPPAAQKPKPDNPLEKLIKNLFPGKQPGPGARRPVPLDADETKIGGRDPIDMRAPHSLQHATMLRRAGSLIDDGDWRRAVDLLQGMLDSPDHASVLMPDGRCATVRSEANRLLGQLPSEVLDDYRKQYGQLAQAMLEEARRSGDQLAYVEVAERFFHTSAGESAANHLGTLHFDRGEFGLAGLWFDRLLQSDSEFVGDPGWRAKATFALQQSQNDETSRKMLSAAQKTRGQGGRLQLGGQDVDFSTWLKTMRRPTGLSAPLLEEWPLFFGTAGRNGRSAGGEPLLLPRWSHALTDVQPIRDQIDELTNDLVGNGHATVPAFFPLMINGKVAVRTLRGVRVIDADTGASLWESEEGVSAERILSGDRITQQNGRPAWQLQARRSPSRNAGNQAEHLPLAGLLFRNGLYGILSSDGRQLFVIEDQAILSTNRPGYSLGFEPTQNDVYRRDWSSNRLTSYELESGRPLWEVGGVAMDEPFDLPLAGVYFCGAPVPVDGDLFVVGEKDNEVRLYALDGEDGQPKWSCLVGFSDAKIDRDFGRRWFTSQVSVSQGIIVCPTSIGWLVAIDRLQQSVLWAYRYSPPQRTAALRGRQRGAALVPTSSLNELWCAAPPVISGNHVLYTPAEDNKLICLNLLDGKVVWQKSKGSNLYLAGVDAQRTLLVGNNAVTALSITTGETEWTAPLGNPSDRPSGRGLIVSDRYYLPLQSGRLLILNLETGTQLAEMETPAGNPGLGNLAMYRGRLISLSAQGITGFQQLTQLENEIHDLQLKNPLDAWAAVHDAEIHLHRREFSQALAAMDGVAAGNVPSDLLPRLQQAQWLALNEVVNGNLTELDKEFAQLESLALATGREVEAKRLAARRHMARKQFEQAFVVYADLGLKHDGTELSSSESPAVSVRLDRWAAGRLADVWQQLTDDARQRLSAGIEQQSQELLTASVPKAERFANLYRFHPATDALILHLAEVHMSQGRLLQAERWLRSLIHIDRPAVAEAALLHLAGMYRSTGSLADAAANYELAALRNPSSQTFNGVLASEAGAILRQQLHDSAAMAAQQTTWSNTKLQLSRGSGASFSSSTPNTVRVSSLPQADSPFFRDFRFDVDAQRQRFSLVRKVDESLFWSVPLRMNAGSPQQGNIETLRMGRQIVVLHRDVLHCLSSMERKLLWAKPLDLRSTTAAGRYYRRSERLTPMQRAKGMATRAGIGKTPSDNHELISANTNFIAVHSNRELIVFDAATGDVRWRHVDTPESAVVHGGEDVLLVVPRDEEESFVLRAIDGKVLDVADLASLAKSAIVLRGNSLLLVEESTGSTNNNSESPNVNVRLHNLLSHESHVVAEFDAGSLLGMFDQDTLAVTEPDADFHLLNLDGGTRRKLGNLSGLNVPLSTERYVVTDGRLAYLILNKSGASAYAENLASLRANGVVIAFDLNSGEQLWQREVTGQNLVLEQFEHLPVLLFVARKYERNGARGFWSTHILALDKTSGQPLLDSTTPSSSGFRNLAVNLADGYIELSTYNSRVRLMRTGHELTLSDAQK